MASIFNSNNCLTAWQDVSSRIIQNGNLSNVLVTINNPCDFKDLPQWLIDRNPKRLVGNADNIRHVINTIFPYSLSMLCCIQSTEVFI